MAYTQADKEAVQQAKLALATGRRVVKFVIDGEEVEYARADMPALSALEKEISAALAAADASSGTARYFNVHGGKGL